MIVPCKDIISQTLDIGKIRLESIPLNGIEFDLEGDMSSIEKIIFGAVANIDSRINDPSYGFNPDDFVFAIEIRSDLKSFNPFVNQTQENSLGCFSRCKMPLRDDLDATASRLESRIIDS